MTLIRRLPRDLKKNWFRYSAILFLVILCVHLVISLMGSAATVIEKVDEGYNVNRVEDGQFSVMVPLSRKTLDELENKGVALEKQAYMDFDVENKSILRIFKIRKSINLFALDSGRLPKASNEIALEKLYANSKGLMLGGQIKVAGIQFTIVGLGSTPDYDDPKEKFSDAASDKKTFGVSFVTNRAYKKLNKTDVMKGLESQTYAYRLEGTTTSQELRDELSDLEISKDDVNEEYMIKEINRFEKPKNEMKSALSDLKNGSNDLSNAGEKLEGSGQELKKTLVLLDMPQGYINELSKYMDQINTSAAQLNQSAGALGIDSKQINKEKNKLDGNLNDLIEYQNALTQLKSGFEDYIDGVNTMSDGISSFDEGVGEFKDETEDVLDEYFDYEINNLTEFIEKEDNPRIGASKDDLIINYMAGLIAGLLVIALVSYIMSVFAVHTIDKERNAIGTLYALGIRKSQLILHYLTVPALITLIGSTLGVLTSLTPYGIKYMMESVGGYYSYPEVTIGFIPKLMLPALMIPLLLSLLINFLFVNHKLSQTPLDLLKKMEASTKNGRMKLQKLNFINSFKIRQILKEKRTSLAVFVGLFLALLIMMMGLTTYSFISELGIDNERDINYEYMVNLKYPPKKVPKGAEKVFAKTLFGESVGVENEVTLMGIDEDNKYFGFRPQKGKNIVTIGSGTANKFGLKIGDKIILSDKTDDIDYVFTVNDIVPYSVGLHVFMDIESMRELLRTDEDSYNVLLADNKLDVDEGRIYSVTHKEDILKSSGVFMDMMRPMMVLLVGVSSIIFVVVLYLMLKVMVDRASLSISLMKIFGYREREIRKLYLDGTFLTVLFSVIIGIPLAKLVMDRLWPYMISNVAIGPDLGMPTVIYILLFISIMVFYTIIRMALMRKVKQIDVTEVLKNRE